MGGMTKEMGLRNWLDALRPEEEIVLCCARAQVDPAAKDRVRALVGSGLHWPDVVANSIHHRLSPIVVESIAASAQDLVPPAQMRVLREAAGTCAENGMSFLLELLRLYQLFEEAQIPVIPYKGPVLAWVEYGSHIHRNYGDLDFAVPQKYIPEAAAVMKSAGYHPQFDAREAHAGESSFAPGQYSFCLSPQNFLVELHSERTLRYFPRPLDFTDLTGRLMNVEIAGKRLRTFSVEDTLVMLCVHGAKHFWERLAWVLDIAKLVTVREVNWSLLLQIAEKMECRRVLLLGLYLAHDLFGAWLPPHVLELARGDRKVRKLAEKVYEQYAGASDRSMGMWPRLVFRLRSRDAIGPGFRHMFRLVLSPTESDRQTVRLPGLLAPLYLLVRPWRLLREYGLGLKRKVKPDLAIYLPTPPEIVNHMLRFAGISPGDVLYDLGCGDGRIVVAAAEKYGIHALGVDTNPKRIAEARANARRHGVEPLAEFHQTDAKKFSVAGATVVTMYLGADANMRLVEKLRSELRSGARIVSRDFKIYGWPADRTETHALPDGQMTSLFLWTIRKDEEEIQFVERAAPELREFHKTEG